MKKSIFKSFLLAAAATLCVASLTACNNDSATNTNSTDNQNTVTEGNNDNAQLNVAFMVEENGEWKQYGASQEVVDGKITMPTPPTKDYYTFVDWYETKDFTGQAFKNENIKSSKTLYARFSAKQVDVYINGESQGKKNIAEVINGSYNPGEGLDFDGWYTNEECTVKYENTDDANTLYARSVAKITYYNGYETCYEVKVKPNSILGDPASTTVELDDGTETTALDLIMKDYMDPNNSFFVDEEGNDFDFSKPITKSQTIFVDWNSPGLDYRINQESGNLTHDGWSPKRTARAVTTIGGASGTYNSIKDEIASWPVVRFADRARVTIDGETKVMKVDGFIDGENLDKATSANTILFGDNVEFIGQFNGDMLNSITKIEMPKNLKMIYDSFNNFKNIKFEIPSKVEVIINSFWAGRNYSQDYVTDSTKMTVIGYEQPKYGYDYEIKLPDSIKNLSQVPTNFTFGENSKFYKDSNNRIFMNNDKGLVLIADTNVDENGWIIVPEGVVGIQVGAFFDNPKIRYIKLPSTWEFINPNAEQSDYLSYWFRKEGVTAFTNCVLHTPESDENPELISTQGTTIYDNFNGTKYGTMSVNGVRYSMEAIFEAVIIDKTEMPSGVYNKVFGGDYTLDSNFGKVQFVGKIESGNEAKIYVKLNQTQLSQTSTKVLTLTSGTELTEEVLKDKLGFKDNVQITSILDSGKEFETSAIDSNKYLTINYEFKPCGYTAELVDDHYVITGFDEDGAAEIDDGYVLVYIPEEINGIKVTEIAEGAFMNKQAIASVFLSKNLEKIGANAFKNCVNLSSVKFEYGNLTYIGDSAFENTKLAHVVLRTDNLEYVGPYAFKIRTLANITTLEEDGNNTSLSSFENAVVGRFYSIESGKLLVKYMGKSVEKQYADATHDEATAVDVNVYDVQVYAMAPKAEIWFSYAVGNSYRNRYAGTAAQYADLDESDPMYPYAKAIIDTVKNVTRYEIMTGSMYYLNVDRKDSAKKPLVFGLVKKIHTNGFTDCDNEYFFTLNERTKTNTDGSTETYQVSNFCFHRGQYTSETLNVEDYWTTEEQVKTMDSEIFEEGWWCGITSSDTENYAKLVDAMQHAYNFDDRCAYV